MQQLQISSLATVIEGESRTVRVTVTNATTKSGVPWSADLDIGIMATSTYHTLISAKRDTYHFGAGQSLQFDYPMATPLGSGGETGSVWTRVFDPTGAVLAETSEPITIEALPPPEEEFTATYEQCEEMIETATPEEYDAAVDDAYDEAAAEAEAADGVVAWSVDEGFHVITWEEAASPEYSPEYYY